MKLAVQIFPPVCVVCLLLEEEIDGQPEVVAVVGSELPIDSLKLDICILVLSLGYIYIYRNPI